jgi:riboflavin synthase
MFTGLIQSLGTIERVTGGAMTDVWVDSTFEPTDFVHGESISCDGVCLTVVEFQGTRFKVQAAPETLRRSTLSSWQPGTTVNLEKALRAGERLGGHLVQGHVDGVATVLETRPEGGSWVMRFSLPVELAAFFVEKGSVCIDGVSLTVTTVESDRFGVMLIPETRKATALGVKTVGAKVNLEADIIGKYVARMMGLRGALTHAQLKAAGF